MSTSLIVVGSLAAVVSLGILARGIFLWIVFDWKEKKGE